MTALSAFCLVVLASAVIRAAQWLLQSRAQRLLSDIRELQSIEGTWGDAQKIMLRWRPWGLGESFCTPQVCFFNVRMRDPIDRLIRGDLDRPPRFRFLIWPSQLLGEKFTFVEASLRVKDGMVEESRFRMNFFGQDEGMARSVNTPAALGYDADRWQHPNYYAEEHPGCEGCVLFETGSTPFAGREKVRDLTDFSLSCITRWSPCSTEADVMPSAWKLYQLELPRKSALEKAFNDCQIPLDFYGRETHAIAVADVLTRQGPTPQGGKGSSARLRIVRSLKGQMPWPKNTILTASSDSQGEEVFWIGKPDLEAGRRYILFGDIADGSVGENVFWLDVCGIVAHNEQSLTAIQRGISASLNLHLSDH
jgi:hypothetical protein